MTDPIEPALSSDEWRDALSEDMRDGLAYEVSYLWGRQRPHAAIAIANAALPDTDDRKITLEKVANIRNAADALAGNDGGGRRDAFDAEQDRLAAAALHAFADALASYLPPE